MNVWSVNVGVDLQVALRVAGHLRGAHLAQLRVHRLPRALGGRDQIDLVALDRPARRGSRDRTAPASSVGNGSTCAACRPSTPVDAHTSSSSKK